MQILTPIQTNGGLYIFTFLCVNSGKRVNCQVASRTPCASHGSMKRPGEMRRLQMPREVQFISTIVTADSSTFFLSRESVNRNPSYPYQSLTLQLLIGSMVLSHPRHWNPSTWKNGDPVPSSYKGIPKCVVFRRSVQPFFQSIPITCTNQVSMRGSQHTEQSARPPQTLCSAQTACAQRWTAPSQTQPHRQCIHGCVTYMVLLHTWPCSVQSNQMTLGGSIYRKAQAKPSRIFSDSFQLLLMNQLKHLLDVFSDELQNKQANCYFV